MLRVVHPQAEVQLNFTGIKMFAISDAKISDTNFDFIDLEIFLISIVIFKHQNDFNMTTHISQFCHIFIQSILTFLIIQTVVSCLFIFFIKFLKNVDQVETEKCQQSQLFIPKNSDNNSQDFKPWSYPKASL